MSQTTKDRMPALASRFIAQSHSLRRVLLLLDQEARFFPETSPGARHDGKNRRNLCPGGFSCPHCDHLP